MSNVISLADFNSNFVTSIRNIEKGHTDETGTYAYGVGFNIICTKNNRVMYFESHLTPNQVPEGMEEGDVANMAWSNVLPHVKTWASTVMQADNLVGSVYVPKLEFGNTSNIELSTFNSNFTTKVGRFEVYPRTAPKSWCVGFHVLKNSASNDTKYYDTNVLVDTFAVQKQEEDIMDAAWSNIRDVVGGWATVKQHTSPLLNTDFTHPTDW